MTGPTTELWRVLDDHPAAPAHLVTLPNGPTVTACGWRCSPGKLITRAEMFTHRFACTNCMRHAKRQRAIGAEVRDNRGGRA